MKEPVTDIALLWHLHQPLYKVNRSYILPWVRLHAVKDYYPMAKIAEQVPSIKLTFNFSGILLQQLLDYAQNSVEDYYQQVSLKDPKDLTPEERVFITERFFSIHPKWSILPYPRYKELYQKHTAKAPKQFSHQDILDTQVYFNLIWFHSISIEKDARLKKLFKKEKNFDADDKKYIISKQYEILKEAVALYKKLFTEKKIEVSVSPHYHPIIPLVCDTDIMRNYPYLKTPGRRLRHPEDAHFHISHAKKFAESYFEQPINGSWPSEGSVSEQACDIFSQEGIKWIATDEDILFNSLKNAALPYEEISKQRHLVSRPYAFENMSIFFRDKNISNMMSFVYQNWDNQAAAAKDVAHHLENIHNAVSGMNKENIVLIAMDGENAWEYYHDNGRMFLTTFYQTIAGNKNLRFTTPNDYLERRKLPMKRLQRVAPGSWINADFSVWAGSTQNNRYWFWLKQLRDTIEQNKEKLDARAYQKIMDIFYILEGSDWYWWNTYKEASGEFKNIFSHYLDKLQKLLEEHQIST